MDSHKKIQTLLSLSGLSDSEVSYFIKEPPAKAIVRQKPPRKLQNPDAAASSASSGTGPDRHTRNYDDTIICTCNVQFLLMGNKLTTY